jgi:hypothetical protein
MRLRNSNETDINQQHCCTIEKWLKRLSSGQCTTRTQGKYQKKKNIQVPNKNPPSPSRSISEALCTSSNIMGAIWQWRSRTDDNSTSNLHVQMFATQPHYFPVVQGDGIGINCSIALLVSCSRCGHECSVVLRQESRSGEKSKCLVGLEGCLAGFCSFTPYYY